MQARPVYKLRVNGVQITTIWAALVALLVVRTMIWSATASVANQPISQQHATLSVQSVPSNPILSAATEKVKQIQTRKSLPGPLKSTTISPY